MMNIFIKQIKELKKMKSISYLLCIALKNTCMYVYLINNGFNISPIKNKFSFH